MSEEKEIKKDRAGITRRKFLKDAGIVVGGTAIGSAFFLSACGEKVEVTKTVTTTAPGATITTTVPGTPGGTATETKTVTKYICPVCSQEFDTLDALKAHFDSAHEGSTSVDENVINLTVNGEECAISVEPNWTLAKVLREKLNMAGTKVACNNGVCGFCTVLSDGKPILSCMALCLDMAGKTITTIESLATGDNLHPIQEAWIEKFGAQCGYCTPGFIVATKALLDTNPQPTDIEVKQALAGNICTCGNYEHILTAVMAAAQKMKEEGR
jgi:carbon-monoxide dehydrogenase small subunit